MCSFSLRIILIEKYWKEPGYYSVKFEIRNYKALVYDNIIRSLPKNFGRLGICKYSEYLDITRTSSLFQVGESKVKCGDITFIDISEIEIALLDRLPDEDIITI